ncbi:hypothetical protein CEUSTIGMA_g9196.t1 [Chlamydomonas eustigma]|uniref:4a-hydroxytetrahydrobiopterin dehydratase n=1 Tax=Chlamydomonas eustigma TaxID=1157962 RepID=A0A250XF98_9CHLO|nr:hypothetical protein CEUSTIGMA_g9196.t1 [Chlamydomonas eustigma]|eukprot:GAX81768.1 hypothetical protein CEUSTIGMA_g9196.t1 [Chlamydomonas eustigma]
MQRCISQCRAGSSRPLGSNRCNSVQNRPVGRHGDVTARSTGWADPRHSISEKAMFGEDFGARDPTAGEIASNFSDNVLGNYDTAHVIKVPEKAKQFLGLGSKDILTMSELVVLEGKDLELLKNQAPGWRVSVSHSSGKQSLVQEWKGKDAAAAAEIQKLLQQVPGAEEHQPSSVSLQAETVTVELSTHSLGGLTENDFIIASRMNEVPVKDLIAKRKTRFWA